MANEASIALLEETPQKVLPFLRAIATKVEIRSALAGCGYTEEEQAHGWKLLLEVSGYTGSDVAFPMTDDQKARDAIAELDAWDESGFRRIHAALGRLHPEQDSFLFAGIEPGKGTGAVVSVAMLLDRLDALESSPDRTATRDADVAAIATLAKRGIDAGMRAKLRALVSVAQQAKAPVVVVESNPGEREKKLAELHSWFADWSETARAVIHRRDYLILMGFAKRKRTTSEEPATTNATAVTAPVAEAPASPTGPVVTPNTNGAPSPTVVA